jgi:tetratricopeptide (TPR) repeat protein
MSSKLKHPIFLVVGAAVLAMAVIFVSVYDWKGDSGKTKVTYRTTQRTAPVTVSQPAPPATATQPSAIDTPEPVEEVAAAQPEPPKEVTYEEAEAAYHERNYEEAASLFTRYTERKSENPWGFYMLGLSSWKAGDNEAAEAAFKRALELDPNHLKSHINLARVLLETGHPDYALVQAGNALDIDSTSGDALRLRGVAYQRLGKTEEAIDAYRRAIQIDQTDAWSMNNLGLIYIEQGRADEALPALARAVELRDDVAVFFNNLGMALELTGRFRAAEENYAKAVAVDPSHEKANDNLTRIEPVVESEGIEPVDLAALAKAFVAEIESWSVAQADSDQEQFVETPADSIVVSEASTGVADSTATQPR